MGLCICTLHFAAPSASQLSETTSCAAMSTNDHEEESVEVESPTSVSATWILLLLRSASVQLYSILNGVHVH